MIGLLLRKDLQGLVRRSPLRLGLVVLYAALAVWAGVDGLRWKKAVVDVQSQRSADLLKDRAEWMAELEDVVKNGAKTPFAARPMKLTLQAALPPGPLAELAHQRESIHPHTTQLSGFRNDASLFRRYEVEGPSALAMPAFDLTHLAIVLFPLVLLLLVFDALSGERQSGRLRLLMVQGARPGQLVVARLLTVAVPLWAVTVLVATAVALLGSGSAALGGRLVLWLVGFTAYAALWMAIAAWIAARFSRGSEAAMAALVAWVVGVLLVPSFAQFAAEAVYPTPSRVAYLSDAREAEGQARRELDRRTDVYMTEHGLETGKADEGVPGFYRASYLANVHVNASTAPMMARFEQQRAAQARVADRVQFAAPPMLAHRILQDAAGAGVGRAAEFRREAREHLQSLHEAVGPATVGRTRLSLEQARAIPEFRFAEPPVAVGTWLGVGWLLLLAALGFVAARRAIGGVVPLDT